MAGMSTRTPARLSLLWLIGLNLRVSLLALPPILPLIHRDLGLSQAGIAALVGLPLLLFAIGAVPGALLAARVGTRRALIIGLLLIGVCAALRGVGPSAAMLFAATLGLGVAIAIIQPVLPALAELWFPSDVTRATSVWTNGLLVGTIVSASLSLPLVMPLVGGNWSWTLLVWALPAPLAALLLRRALGHERPVVKARSWRARLPNWRHPDVWRIGLVQAAGTLGFFGASTFIPDYLHATGRPELIAASLASLGLGQLPGSLLVGFLPGTRVARRTIAIGVGGSMLLALVTLLVAPGTAFIVAAGVLGAASGATLVLTLALPPLMAAPADVPRTTAGVLAIGYSTVWLMLLAAGAAWDAFHQPATGLLPIALGGVVVLLLAPRLLVATAVPDARVAAPAARQAVAVGG
jgi:MFS transporter, CP family, cyanate transporter